MKTSQTLSAVALASVLLLSGCSQGNEETPAPAQATAPAISEVGSAIDAEAEKQAVADTVRAIMTELNTFEEVETIDEEMNTIKPGTEAEHMKEALNGALTKFNVDLEEEKNVLIAVASYSYGFIPVGSLMEPGDTFDVKIPLEAVTIDGDKATVDNGFTTIHQNGEETPLDSNFPREKDRDDPFYTTHLTKVDGEWLVDIHPDVIKMVDEEM